MLSGKAVDTCSRILSGSEDATCSSELKLGFFFDGMGCEINGTQYGDTRSNIAKLWGVFRATDASSDLQHFDRFYFSGLGTELNASLASGFGGSVHRAPDEISAGVEGQSQGAGVEAGKDTINGNGGRPWYETFSKTFKDSFTDWKGWVKEIRNGAIRAGAEIFEPIRDTSIAASLLMSGASTRLDMAEQSFLHKVEEVTLAGGAPLRSIRVSVFGFDFGAALGKRFIRNLLENLCIQSDGKFLYNGMEVVVEFAGFFDCVDRTHPEMGPLDWMHPLTPVLDDGGDLHPAVVKALHLVAAHERRFYRRSRTLGTLKANWSEELFPGISPDVGGGLEDDNQKPSSELSKVALHRMYNAAYRAGVPIPHMDDLAQADRQIAQQFEFNHVVGSYTMFGLVRHYERFMRAHRDPKETAFRAHTLLYLYWQSQRFAEYRYAKSVLEGSQEELPGWLRTRVSGLVAALTDSDEDHWEAVKRERDRLDTAIEELDESWGWLNQVDEEATDLVRRFESTSPSVSRHARLVLQNECLMAYRWKDWIAGKNLPNDVPNAVMLLFSHGMHDSVPEKMDFRSHQQTSLFHGYRYFSVRGLDLPS
ncbi:DUF2235 domain-containing protein [Marinobacter sp. HL-58]|uniref:phospholipase effector Tle1 domain-containing protein n=1 Tax=Marinobacter sp. HL-58 TaxID=1479237 RepID=UPI000489E33A|nr:DUF2235 domain-containing protein [Marinobacter sp. HL-58]KPP97867.1 MAG: putative alpha/beta hydrolase domain (DUF2235) [Marinobacter sp. HL-58]